MERSFQHKSIDNIEKGILRRALKPALPDDVRNRRKSAYPTSQDPHYLQTIRNLTLEMCSNKNNPIFSLINHSTLLAIANQSNKEINNFEARSAMEYMLQVNEWLKTYHIHIA